MIIQQTKGRINLEKILNEILVKLNNIEFDVQELKKLKPMVKELRDLKPKIEESHIWISALIENKEVQKAEMEALKIDVAKVTGVLKGFDNSLGLLKEAK
jgi:hypothetical protein